MARPIVAVDRRARARHRRPREPAQVARRPGVEVLLLDLLQPLLEARRDRILHTLPPIRIAPSRLLSGTCLASAPTTEMRVRRSETTSAMASTSCIVAGAVPAGA